MHSGPGLQTRCRHGQLSRTDVAEPLRATVAKGGARFTIGTKQPSATPTPATLQYISAAGKGVGEGSPPPLATPQFPCLQHWLASSEATQNTCIGVHEKILFSSCSLQSPTNVFASSCLRILFLAVRPPNLSHFSHLNASPESSSAVLQLPLQLICRRSSSSSQRR